MTTSSVSSETPPVPPPPLTFPDVRRPPLPPGRIKAMVTGPCPGRCGKAVVAGGWGYTAHPGGPLWHKRCLHGRTVRRTTATLVGNRAATTHADRRGRCGTPSCHAPIEVGNIISLVHGRWTHLVCAKAHS